VLYHKRIGIAHLGKSNSKKFVNGYQTGGNCTYSFFVKEPYENFMREKARNIRYK